MVICQLSHLTTGYRTGQGVKTISQGLDATLPSGQMTCLLGANGTGKSTLLRTICGFLKPLSGHVSVAGREVAGLSAREMSRLVAVVLTDRVEIPNATVTELVQLGRSPYTGFMGRLGSDDVAIACRAMQQAGIWHKRHQTVTSLSDGERQKALIAKALAQETPLIVLDEPTAFLDLPARVEIMQLLRSLCSDKGVSIFMTTHDLDLALQMADRLWLLQPDRPLVTGSPEDLMLQDAFAAMFAQSGIEFDIRTGLFQIQHPYRHHIAVKGHGFGYVLLRRALARLGIRTVGYGGGQALWIDIRGIDVPEFAVMYDAHLLLVSPSVERVVAQVVDAMASIPMTKHMNVSNDASI